MKIYRKDDAPTELATASPSEGGRGGYKSHRAISAATSSGLSDIGCAKDVTIAHRRPNAQTALEKRFRLAADSGVGLSRQVSPVRVKRVRVIAQEKHVRGFRDVEFIIRCERSLFVGQTFRDVFGFGLGITDLTVSAGEVGFGLSLLVVFRQYPFVHFSGVLKILNRFCRLTGPEQETAQLQVLRPGIGAAGKIFWFVGEQGFRDVPGRSHFFDCLIEFAAAFQSNGEPIIQNALIEPLKRSKRKSPASSNVFFETGVDFRDRFVISTEINETDGGLNAAEVGPAKSVIARISGMFFAKLDSNRINAPGNLERFLGATQQRESPRHIVGGVPQRLFM